MNDNNFRAELGCVEETNARVLLLPMSSPSASLMGREMSAIEPWSRYPISSSALETFLSTFEPGAPRYEINAGGNCVGTITIRENWLRGPYVQSFALLPAAQGQGLGRLVMQWVENKARANNDRYLWVATSDFNARALRFYERLGYSRFATLDALLQDDRDEILLRKRV